jgi:hypothetical protein
MGCADATITHGAIMAGMLVGSGYLIVFPFWMIHKINKVEIRIKQMQADIIEQDNTRKSFEQRVEVLDHNFEEQRKDIITAINSMNESDK